MSDRGGSLAVIRARPQAMRMSDPVASVPPMLSRRELFGAAMAAGAVAALGPVATPLLLRGPAVVSFHRDAPYLDPTGTAEPYLPRIATDWADDLDDEALIRLGLII